MNEKLRELRSKCSEKEAKFLEFWVNGQEKFNAYKNAGFKAKSTKVASAGVCRLLKKVNCLAYFEALKDKRDLELQRKSKITREYLVKKLSEIVEKPDNQSVKVSACREIADLLGFHRELGINPEKERQKREIGKEHRALIREIAAEITQKLAEKRQENGPKPGLRLTTA